MKGKKIVGFDIFNYAFFFVAMILCVFPVLHIFAKSLSGNTVVMQGLVGFWPKDFQLDTYKQVLMDTTFLRSIGVSVFITVFGTIASVFLTAITAYPLSKKELKGSKLILGLFIFSWMCGPAIIPMYILINKLGLINSVFSLILPVVINSYNLLIMKSNYESLPPSLTEAAKIDGASNIRILFSIAMPLCKATLATLAVFYALGYWNSFINAYMFINTPESRPLQLYLYELINAATFSTMNPADPTSITAPDTLRSAAVIISIVPMMCIYPFFQKYFVSGVMLGSVKE